jgi:DNA-binding transcriptional LysR family regulator
MEELFRNLQQELEPWTSARNRVVAVGCCCIAGKHIVPSYTMAFRRLRPHVSVQCHVGRCADIFERLLNGVLDVAVAGVPPRDPQLVSLPFVRMPLTCFEARKDPPRRLSIKALTSEPVVLCEEGSGTRAALQKFLQHHGLAIDQLTVAATSESNEALKEMVASGMGWSILPHVVIQNELAQGRLSLLPLDEGSPVQDFFVVYRKNALLSRPQREFVDLLLQKNPGLDRT